MHVTRTDISETEVSLEIKATTEDLLPSKQKIIEKLAPQVKVPGFRGGKVPPQLVEKHADPSILQSEFLDQALTDLYSQATQAENVRPVTRPEVTVKKFVPFTTLEFEVKTSVLGPVKLGKYKGIKIKTDTKVTTDKDVKDVLSQLQIRLAEKNDVDRAAKKGDQVWIDFKGVDAKGNPINGADGKDYPLNLGSNTFIPGFEDNLIGAKAGEEKAFTLTFPKDYGVKALASKKVTFTVNVTKVQEAIEPKLDDEFAAKAGPFTSLKELKDDIKKQLEQEAANENHKAKQNEAVKQVVDSSSVAIPQALIDQQVIYELDELKRNLTYRGQTYEEFLEAEGKTEDQYKKEAVEPRAAFQVKSSIVLSLIAENESLAISPEELEIQMQILKGQYKDPAMQAELDKHEARHDIASRMLSEKVVNTIVQNSV